MFTIRTQSAAFLWVLAAGAGSCGTDQARQSGVAAPHPPVAGGGAAAPTPRPPIPPTSSGRYALIIGVSEI
jgi:hypothetical protein